MYVAVKEASSGQSVSSVPEVLVSLTKKLGLLQTEGKDAAQQWARRTRELQAQYPQDSLDQAAIASAAALSPFTACRIKNVPEGVA
jgi:hypothetical protein